jgi:hypothetical protein
MKQSFRAWLPCVANGQRKVRRRIWRKNQLKLNHRNQKQLAKDTAELRSADTRSSCRGRLGNGLYKLLPSRPMRLLSHLEMGSRVHQGQLKARDWTQAYPFLQVYNKQTNKQTNKSEVPEQKIYAQAAGGISRVAIAPMAYPDRKFDEEEVALLKRLVKGRILDLVRGTKAPIFQGTSDRDGTVIFNCADVETVERLKSLTTVLTIQEGLQLRALGVDELPKRHRVVVHVEDRKMSVKETLELLDRQNKGLATSEWIVVRGNESRDSTSAHFAALIGDRLLEELKALNFKPYCGLG